MTCKLKSCDLAVKHIGLCNRHYLQKRRHGKFLEATTRDNRPAVIDGGIAEIPLGLKAKDGFAIVDKKFAYLSKDNWRLTHYGYVVRSKDHKLLHRVICKVEKGMVVDHINHDLKDNRKANLRVCSQSDNAKNQNKRVSNTTGFKGVSRQRKKFVARIKHNYKQIRIGTFDTALEASYAYDNAAKNLHGDFARLNHG